MAVLMADVKILFEKFSSINKQIERLTIQREKIGLELQENGFKSGDLVSGKIEGIWRVENKSDRAVHFFKLTEHKTKSFCGKCHIADTSIYADPPVRFCCFDCIEKLQNIKNK